MRPESHKNSPNATKVRTLLILTRLFITGIWAITTSLYCPLTYFPISVVWLHWLYLTTNYNACKNAHLPVWRICGFCLYTETTFRRFPNLPSMIRTPLPIWRLAQIPFIAIVICVGFLNGSKLTISNLELLNVPKLRIWKTNYC